MASKSVKHERPKNETSFFSSGKQVTSVLLALL